MPTGQLADVQKGMVMLRKSYTFAELQEQALKTWEKLTDGRISHPVPLRDYTNRLFRIARQMQKSADTSHVEIGKAWEEAIRSKVSSIQQTESKETK